MNRYRRKFIKRALGTALALPGLALLLKSLPALAAWNSDAFSTNSITTALAELFPGKKIVPDDRIEIGVDPLVENGAVVPIQITADLPAPDSITILVEKNPNPLIAHFELSPQCKGFLATRIKVAQPSDITVVVKSKGSLYSATRFVEVLEGGCG